MIAPGLYRHFKGNYYQVLHVAQHSETQEAVVVYQACYGEKGIWVRPLSMFDERIERDGKSLRRFARVEQQTPVLEVAILNIKAGENRAFEAAFESAQGIIQSMSGYLRHELRRCEENSSRYILLVHWQALEDHTVGFRESSAYQQWRDQLHHFYQPFPTVEHYRAPLFT